MAFSEFLLLTFGERVAAFESIDPAAAPRAEVETAARDASSLKQVITDLHLEGWHELVDQIVSQTNAIDRLESFLPAALRRLGHESERERFHLFPEVVEVKALSRKAFADGEVHELGEYLEALDERSEQPVDISAFFATSDEQRRFEEKTQALLYESLLFMKWILRRIEDDRRSVPVPLLRDTLFVHFGLSLARHHGAAIPEPRPLFLSRKLAAQFENGLQLPGPPGEAIYFLLLEMFYAVLLEGPVGSLEELQRRFRAAIHESSEIPESFTRAGLTLLDSLKLSGPPLFVESGAHGTFPLWLLAISGISGDMVLHTPVPWLYKAYEGAIFRKNFNYLSDLESITAQEYLFQLREFDQDRILVVETSDEVARGLALYELYTFKELVRNELG